MWWNTWDNREYFLYNDTLFKITKVYIITTLRANTHCYYSKKYWRNWWYNSSEYWTNGCSVFRWVRYSVFILWLNFFQLASTGTNALNAACQHLMAEQTKMSEFSEKLAEKLSHYVRVERIIQKLNSPSMSVMSEAFPKLLDEIDESSAFLEQHVRISNNM